MTGADFDDDLFCVLAPETFSSKVEREPDSESVCEAENDSPSISQEEFPTPVKTEFGFDEDCKSKRTERTKRTVAVKGEKERPRQPIEPKSEEELTCQTILDYEWTWDYGDQYVPPMFELARRLSAYPSLRGIDPDVAADYVQAIRPFHTFPGVDSDFDEPGRDQFVECWLALRLQTTLGKKAYMIALSEAKRELLPVNRLSGRAGTRHFNEVVNFCFRLQMVQGDKPFLLSGRTLSDVLAIHYTNACLFIIRLQRERFIEVVEKPRKQQQRAGRYRFIGKLVNGALAPRDAAGL